MTGSLPEWNQNVGQPVVINLMHQGQEPANLSAGEAFTSEPVKVVPRQIGDQSSLVLAKGHLPRDQQFQVLGFHPVQMPFISPR